MNPRKRMLVQKGRAGGDSEHFAMLPVEVLESVACRTLPHVAHRVMVALAAQYSGKNNGSLSLTRRTATNYGIANTHTLAASLRELEARGLILQTRPGTRIPPRSAFYAVTWRIIDPAVARDAHDVNATLKPPDDWRKWTTDKRRAHWTVKRRAARWRKATRESGARPLGQSKMSGARPRIGTDSSVAHGHGSYILGVGRQGESFGKYPNVGAMNVIHRRTCRLGRSAFAESV